MTASMGHLAVNSDSSGGQPDELYEKILETLQDADTDHDNQPNVAKLCREPEKKLKATWHRAGRCAAW